MIRLKNIGRALVFLGVYWSSLGLSQAHAEVMEENSITSLTQVATKLTALLYSRQWKAEELLIVSDWDNVITSENGDDLPLRERGTAQTVASFFEMKVPFVVETSREYEIPNANQLFVGLSDDQKLSFMRQLYSGASTRMGVNLTSEIKKINFNFNEEFNLLISKNLLKKESLYYEAPGFQVLATNGILFAHAKPRGTNSAKGTALVHVLDSSWLSVKPKVILFVDDAKFNITSMREAFRNRREKVYLFHFPENSFWH